MGTDLFALTHFIEVSIMTSLAFGTGALICVFACKLIVNLFAMARAKMPDIEDIEP